MDIDFRQWKRVFICSFLGFAILLVGPSLSAEEAASSQTPSQTTYREVARWQTIGGDYQQFDQPCDVAIDHRNQIYIADCTLRVVFKFDATGKLLSVWTGSPEIRFANPASIAIDVNDVYVVDRYESRVFHFDLDGNFKNLWQLRDNEEGDVSEALGICINPMGLIYIADHNRDRINSYSPKGEFISSFGDKAEGKAKLFGPTDLICDAEGNVLTISFNDRLVKFAPNGSVLGSWGDSGDKIGQFDDARGLAIDSQGNVYVADTENGRIQRLSASLFSAPNTKDKKAKPPTAEELATQIISWGQNSTAGSVLKKPTGIAVMTNGIVIVTDPLDGSVTLWKPISSAPQPQAAPTPPSSSPSPQPSGN